MRSTSLVASFIVAVPSIVLAHGGDVGLALINQRLVTGEVVDDGSGGEIVIPGERVFAGELGDPVPGFGTEPGFFAAEGLLPGGSGVGLNLMAALRRWDGAGWSMAAERVRFERPDGGANVTTPTTDTFTPGWAFTFPGAGDMDDHPNIYVENRAGPGIYLVEFRVFSDLSTIADSASAWMVLNDGGEEADHDAAIEYTEEFVVPAPGAGLMVLAPMLAAVRRRR